MIQLVGHKTKYLKQDIKYEVNAKNITWDMILNFIKTHEKTKRYININLVDTVHMKPLPIPFSHMNIFHYMIVIGYSYSKTQQLTDLRGGSYGEADDICIHCQTYNEAIYIARLCYKMIKHD